MQVQETSCHVKRIWQRFCSLWQVNVLVHTLSPFSCRQGPSGSLWLLLGCFSHTVVQKGKLSEVLKWKCRFCLTASQKKEGRMTGLLTRNRQLSSFFRMGLPSWRGEFDKISQLAKFCRVPAIPRHSHGACQHWFVFLFYSSGTRTADSVWRQSYFPGQPSFAENKQMLTCFVCHQSHLPGAQCTLVNWGELHRERQMFSFGKRPHIVISLFDIESHDCAVLRLRDSTKKLFWWKMKFGFGDESHLSAVTCWNSTTSSKWLTQFVCRNWTCQNTTNGYSTGSVNQPVCLNSSQYSTLVTTGLHGSQKLWCCQLLHNSSEAFQVQFHCDCSQSTVQRRDPSFLSLSSIRVFSSHKLIGLKFPQMTPPGVCLRALLSLLFMTFCRGATSWPWKLTSKLKCSVQRSFSTTRTCIRQWKNVHSHTAFGATSLIRKSSQLDDVVVFPDFCWSDFKKICQEKQKRCFASHIVVHGTWFWNSPFWARICPQMGKCQQVRCSKVKTKTWRGSFPLQTNNRSPVPDPVTNEQNTSEHMYSVNTVLTDVALELWLVLRYRRNMAATRLQRISDLDPIKCSRVPSFDERW